MKLFKLFKRKEPVDLDYDPEDLKGIKKKNRKKALRLLKEYKQGLVIEIDKDVNQKLVMETIRKGL
jgi:hypothetical protein